MNKANQDRLLLIGKTEEEAVKMLRDREYRITRQDKTKYVLTCDYDIDRFNLQTDNGIVTEVTFG